MPEDEEFYVEDGVVAPHRSPSPLSNPDFGTFCSIEDLMKVNATNINHGREGAMGWRDREAARLRTEGRREREAARPSFVRRARGRFRVQY